MDCQQTQETILQAEPPDVDAHSHPDLSAHLAACAPCREFLQKCLHLDTALRKTSPAIISAAARQKFLDRLQPPLSVPVAPAATGAAPPRRHWFTLPEIATAAGILLMIGLMLWILTPASRRPVSFQALLDRLVDVNIQLSQADTNQKRSEIYTRAEPLTEVVHQAALKPDDRVLAQDLVDNAAHLAATDDPLADAERFSHLADLLLKKTEVAAAAGDTATVARIGHNFYLISTKGLKPKLERAEKITLQNAERKRRLELIVGNNQDLQRRLNDLLLEIPNASNKEILRALGITGKKTKNAAPR